MIDAFLFVGFETPLALLMHWLEKPTTKTHPETSTFRNEVHDLDGFYASIHALLGPFPGG